MRRKNYNPYGLNLQDIDIQKREENKKQEKILSEMIQELKKMDEHLKNIQSTIRYLLK